MLKSKQEVAMKERYPGLPYEPHTLEYTITCNAKPDFFLGVSKETGKYVYLELKEYLSVEMVKRELDIMASNPNVDIRYIFKSATVDAIRRLTSKRIKYSHSTTSIPQEWIDECGVSLANLLGVQQYYSTPVQNTDRCSGGGVPTQRPL
jgi:hypothetical protein